MPTDLSLNTVGFTEVGFGDTKISETVRLPVDLSRRVGAAADGHRLDVVLSRLRNEPARRLDEEPTLDRRFVLPDSRSFLVSGTARIEPNATDPVLDTVLGTTAPGTTYTASSRLYGDANARASRAFDGDLATAWTATTGIQAGQYVDVSTSSPMTVDHARLTVVTDGLHSVPTQVSLVADGVVVRTLPLPALADGAAGTVQTVDLGFDPVTTKDLRLRVDQVREVDATPYPGQVLILPVSIAETGLSGVPVPDPPAAIDTGCRADLVRVNGTPFPVAIRGDATAQRTGLDVVACDPSLALPAGSATVTTASGLDTGLDIDRLVLSSSTAGTPAPVTTLGAPVSHSGATVKITSSTPDSYHLQARTDGTPFWLVLGQSHNDGWEATVDGRSLGSPHLVNGFANGWTVRPNQAGTVDIVLRWTPQRAVWIGLAISGLAVLVCLVLVVVRGRRSRAPATPAATPGALDDPPMATSPMVFATMPPSLGATVTAAVGAGVVTALVSRWWIGMVVAVATLVAAATHPWAVAAGGGESDRPRLRCPLRHSRTRVGRDRAADRRPGHGRMVGATPAGVDQSSRCWTRVAATCWIAAGFGSSTISASYATTVRFPRTTSSNSPARRRKSGFDGRPNRSLPTANVS